MIERTPRKEKKKLGVAKGIRAQKPSSKKKLKRKRIYAGNSLESL